MKKIKDRWRGLARARAQWPEGLEGPMYLGGVAKSTDSLTSRSMRASLLWPRLSLLWKITTMTWSSTFFSNYAKQQFLSNSQVKRWSSISGGRR